MVRQIKESDWKLLRRFHRIAVERFCQRVIREISQTVSSYGENHHECFLRLYELIDKRNEELGRIFDDPRRSVAFFMLANIKDAGCLTEEEFSQFSAETREIVKAILS